MSDPSATKTIPPATDQAERLLMSSVSLEPLFHRRLLDPALMPGDIASIDGYSIIRQIGEGGMGLVFLARGPREEHDVAVKLISPQLVNDPRAVHRFLNEARHMSRLSHPNILKVLQVGDRPSGPYYVMPYMSHGSLAMRLAGGKQLDADSIFTVAGGLAKALAYAHDRGIIHRDLKPANLLMDGQGNVHLADFGLVRTVFNDSIVDVQGNFCEGTVGYMSPAVAGGGAEDTRCDIYSFGAILYEMLAGRPPFEGRSSQEVRSRILAGPPLPILKLNPRAAPGLVRIAEGAMARELRDRYAGMEDIASDLDRVALGKPPLGPHGRGFPKWNARTLGRICAVFGLMMVVACGAYVISHLQSREKAESGNSAERKLSTGGSAENKMGVAGDLYVSSSSDGNVLEYNPVSRKFVGIFATAQPGCRPSGVAFAHNGNLYVNNWHGDGADLLSEYNGSTGAFIRDVAKTHDCYGITVNGQDIFVVESLDSHAIHEFSFSGVTGPIFPVSLLKLPLDVTLGPDKNLYVSGRDTAVILKLNSFGAWAAESRFASFPKVTQSHGLTFGPNQNLFASDLRGNAVVEFDGKTGALVRTITGGMLGPGGVAFDADSNLWVTNLEGNCLTEYDFKTGRLLCTITGSELNEPVHITVKPFQ